MKGWAEERVVKELGYLNLNEQTRPHGLEKESHYSRHLNFLRWLNRTFSKKVKIIDIGGGSGTLLHTILSYEKSPFKMGELENYSCYDLNSYCIKNGKETFKDYQNVKFIEQDLDNDVIKEKVDVVYVDSTLTMFEKPYDVLYNLLNISDYVVLNRTPLNDIPQDKKEQFKWGGMTSHSPLWKFSVHQMENFTKSYGWGMNVINITTPPLNSAHDVLSPYQYDMKKYDYKNGLLTPLPDKKLNYRDNIILLENKEPETDPWLKSKS